MLEIIRTERGVGKQVRFVPNTGEGSGRQYNPSKQNCYINKNFLLLEDWQFNHKLCPPLSPTNKLCLKKSPHNLIKYEIKEVNFKNPIFSTL